MANSRVVIRYAKAVLGKSRENKSQQELYQDMNVIADTISAHRDLQLAIQSPIISIDKKVELLKKIFSKISAQSTMLISLLASNKRLNILGQVATKVVELHNISLGEQEVTLTSTVHISDAFKSDVVTKIKESTQAKEVIIHNIIDEKILGGFVLRVGDTEYDASLIGKINKLKKEVVSA